MIDLASALVPPLAKLFLKTCFGEVAADIGDNLLKLGFARLGDRSKAREAKQLAERTAAGVATSLERFFASEHVDPNLLEVAATDLGITVGSHVGAAFLVDRQLDATAIETGLLEARPLDQIYPKGDPVRDAYVRLIQALAPRLREIAPELPHYEIERDAQFFAEFVGLAERSGEILAAIADIRPTIEKAAAGVEELVNRPKQLAEGYEADYLTALCIELNRVEIIGLTVDEPARGGELEVAYLPLRTRLGVRGETRQADFATLLTLMPELGNRILIEGPAGAGKSTLLRWAAIQAARWRLEGSAQDPLAIARDLDAWLPLFLAGDDRHGGRPAGLEEVHSTFAGQADDRRNPTQLLRNRLGDACWRTRMPFLIPLRRSGQAIDLDRLPKLTLRTIEEPPDGWTAAAVKSGLLLIDGVDEVPAGPARQAALSAIDTWTKRFPDAQIVVTSRPGAVPEGALSDFTLVRLDELDEAQRRRFVDHWHRALGRQLRWPEEHPLLAQLAAGVRLEFERQRALDDLAANPLLCGSLCALHWDRRRDAARAAFKNNEMLELGTTILPATRWRICDALTEMLLERREREQPDFYIKDFPEEYRLLYEQKATILSEVAWAMVEDDMRSTMTRKNAEAAVGRALRSRRDRLKAKPPAILKALVERSGLLRGAGEDEIEFAHNTLKAFLAARHYLNAGVATTLARKLVHAELEELRSGLDEVAVFCAASPTGQRFATSLIDKLANGAEELARRGEVERARWLRMLALRCEMSAERLGARKRRVTQGLAVDVFPPRDMEEGRQLAALGEEGIARLAPTDGSSDEEAAAAVRCLRLIGSQAADAAIDAYRDFTAPAVFEELAQVRHPLTLPAVLAAAQDHERWRELPAGVKAHILDAKPLEALTNLQTLDLSGTQVADPRPLKSLTNLRSLDLSRTRVEDLRPPKAS
jgi:hypothetical protein